MNQCNACNDRNAVRAILMSSDSINRIAANVPIYFCHQETPDVLLSYLMSKIVGFCSKCHKLDIQRLTNNSLMYLNEQQMMNLSKPRPPNKIPIVVVNNGQWENISMAIESNVPNLTNSSVLAPIYMIYFWSSQSNTCQPNLKMIDDFTLKVTYKDQKIESVRSSILTLTEIPKEPASRCQPHIPVINVEFTDKPVQEVVIDDDQLAMLKYKNELLTKQVANLQADLKKSQSTVNGYLRSRTSTLDPKLMDLIRRLVSSENVSCTAEEIKMLAIETVSLQIERDQNRNTINQLRKANNIQSTEIQMLRTQINSDLDWAANEAENLVRLSQFT